MSIELITELITVVNEEVRLFHALLEILGQEQRAIVNDDLPAIEEAANAKRELVVDASAAELRRQELVRDLSEGLDVAPDQVDLAKLIEGIDDRHGKQLTQMRETLLELNQKIRTTNANNAFLIRQSMRYTDRYLDILTGHPGDRGMYGKFGRSRKRTGSERPIVNRTV